jgi:hypothetical protein
VCLVCPDGQTSLQGATACYTPCPVNTALNTSDLTCVPIPASINDLADNMDLNITQSDVFVVSESSKLEDTIGVAAENSTQTVVIALGPNVYPQRGSYRITSNLVIVNDRNQGRPNSADRMRHLLARGLQTSVNNSVIVAGPNARHFTIADAVLLTDGVTFVGDPTASSSGGVELDGATAQGIFYTTTFQNCRTTGNGGGLRLTNGASASLYRYV